jgi:hypothetical protein
MRTGQQVYLYQDNNKLPDATITATVQPSDNLPLVYPVTKDGNGNLLAQGAYEGAEDAQFDVEIVDDSFTSPVVSSPVFNGAGSGQIKDIAASGLAAQGIEVLCLSAGVSTQNAQIEIEGVVFRALAAGAAGNAITITVDASPMVFTLTDYSTLKALNVGDTGLEGQEWDWDTKIILGEIIPDAAHRVAFGDDQLHIYRQYKKFEDGKYKYYFIQPIKYEVKAGSKVYFVTQGRTITVTDGVTSEEYTGIITIADFWTAVKALPSVLIEPESSSIDTAKTASSPAVREFTIMTESYVLPAYRGENSSEYAGELTGIVTNAATKTELIEVKCIANDDIGREKWQVKGSSSGDLGEARTGDYNQFGPVAFTIPQKLPPDFENLKEDWSFETEYATRDEGVTPPPICLAMQLGINAKEQTLTLTYKAKPVACSCPPVNFNEQYLGLTEEGGEIGMAYTVEDLIFWTDIVFERMKEQLSSTEQREGREAVASVPSAAFKTLADEYFKLFKTLAQRIMALPENDTADLTAMVTDYKELVNSVNLINDGDPMTWDGSDWDAKWEDTGSNYITDVTYDTDVLQSLADDVLLYEKTYGLKKNSLIPGDVPYTDVASAYYWEVKGDKPYLPAFTDYTFYSVIKQGDTYINTKEFAFHISVPCGGSLLEGDEIIVSINGIQYARTYQIGDITYLPTVAAADLALAGGIDGDDTYVFGVSGSVAGAFANYLLDRDAPLPYYGTLAAAWQGSHAYSLTNYVKAVTFNNRRYECTVAGTSGSSQPTWPTTIGATVVDGGVTWTCRAVELQLEIEDGIIPFAVGDAFEFDIEGGHFKWRKNGGTWSSAIALSTAYQEISEGVEVAFEFGVAPSFETGDNWEILCVQSNKVANMLLPCGVSSKGTGTLTIDLGAAMAVDALIIDGHDLTGTVTFQASNNSGFTPLINTETLTITDLICRLFSTAITARYFRLQITGNWEIGHLFLGTKLRLGTDADKVVPFQNYNFERKEGKAPLSIYNFVEKGFNIDYNTWLENAEFALLLAMIDYLKTLNDMPLYFIPNENYTADCMKGTLKVDNIEPGGIMDYNVPAANRMFTLQLTVSGIS